MLNLLENAVKYGPAGQTVRIRAEWRDGGVRLSVDDEGPGVRPAERELIWQPFRRGASAVGGAVAGSGIGLSVVREIVRSHGGRTRVEDAPGGGARFVVQVPAPRTPAAGRLAGPATVPGRTASAGAA